MKKKFLFILHLPPPIHGSSMVGMYIKNSKIINTSLKPKFINLSTSESIDEIGKKPFKKFTKFLTIIFNSFYFIILKGYNNIYITANSNGLGFYKDLIIVLLAKILRKKIFLHYHNKGVRLYQDKFIYNILYTIMFKNSKVILLSKNLYNDVEKYVKIENVFICPNGIPSVNYSNKKSENKVPRLIFLSNIMKSKGVELLLLAMDILNSNALDFECHIIGETGDISSNELQNKIIGLNLEKKVKFLGAKYDSDKFEELKNGDIFVHPTMDDCFPLVIIEAMQFGLPVISTNIGAIADIVDHGVTGFIVNDFTPKQISNKIKFLIENPSVAIKMGELGRIKFKREYTINNFEKNFSSILN